MKTATITIAFLAVCALGHGQDGVDWTPTSELKKAFRSEYNEAIKRHEKRLRLQSPIITQDLLNMTLHLPDGDSHRFEMEKSLYYALAHFSHLPLTVYSIVDSDGFGPLSNETIRKLSEYKDKVSAAAEAIDLMGLTPDDVARNKTLCNETERYIVGIIGAQSATEKRFQQYALTVRPYVQMNLSRAARSLLVQLDAQTKSWQCAFPNENWPELKVAVLGFHQPRRDYAPMQLFRMLQKEPSYERSVVYVEFQGSIFGKEREIAEKKAVVLLTKVDWELSPANLIFGHESLLQFDVMGPAARQIIDDWTYIERSKECPVKFDANSDVESVESKN